jgi:hypothetical protein
VHQSEHLALLILLEIVLQVSMSEENPHNSQADSHRNSFPSSPTLSTSSILKVTALLVSVVLPEATAGSVFFAQRWVVTVLSPHIRLISNTHTCAYICSINVQSDTPLFNVRKVQHLISSQLMATSSTQALSPPLKHRPICRSKTHTLQP